MSEQRYFVDLRGGCVAVRDRLLTDPEYNGLHADTVGVVQYWHGVQNIERCPKCCGAGHIGTGWEVRDDDAVEAHRLCDKLNAESEAAR